MTKRRLFSALLALCMVMGLLPGAAFAADGEFNHIGFFNENYMGKQCISSISIAVTGGAESLPLSDIKDFSVTLDGEPVDVRLVDSTDTLNRRTEWWNDDESGVSFKFDLSKRLTEPGFYRISFVYNGQECIGVYSIENAFEPGQSAPDDAILIGTEAELRAFAEAVNNGEYEGVNPYVKLTQDIKLTGGEWTPIGAEIDIGDGWTSYVMFNGTFDGGGHSVAGIKIGSKGNPAVVESTGFFLEAPQNVFDLSLEVEIYAAPSDWDNGLSGIGGLAARSSGNIRNCAVSGYIETAGAYSGPVGGLLGNADGFVTECSSSVTIHSEDTFAGGLIGSGGGSVINCYATGDVSGETAGGLIGVGGGYIERCYATGNVTAKPRINEYEGTQYCMGSAGGFCGYISMNGEEEIILCCFASGNVTVQQSGLDCNGGCNAGGFAGNIDASHGSVENCYATGDVRGNRAAGFAADVMSPSPDGSWGDGTFYISHCFASGNAISETGNAAGFASTSIGAWFYDCASLGNVTAKGDAKGFASEFGFAGIERCWSVGDVTSQEGYASIFGYGKNCYAIGNAAGKDAQGHVGENSYFAGTLTAEPNEDGTPKTFKLGETSYGDTTLFPVGFDESVTTGKTTDEMQSTAFADLLNADQSDKPWTYKAGSYPILAAFNQESIDAMLTAGAELEVELKQAKNNNETPNQPDNSSDPQSPDNTPSGDTTPNSGEGSDTKPINPAIYIGGGIVLVCLLAALILFIISRKAKKQA